MAGTLKSIEMLGKTEHNLGAQERHLIVTVADLPKVITLELPDGSKKRYSLTYAPKAEGLILNKAI